MEQGGDACVARGGAATQPPVDGGTQGLNCLANCTNFFVLPGIGSAQKYVFQVSIKYRRIAKRFQGKVDGAIRASVVGVLHVLDLFSSH